MDPDGPGVAWVNNYLLPRMNDHFGDKHLSCIQLFPEDTNEAKQLEKLGHECSVFEGFDELEKLENNSVDLLFTGRFTSKVLSISNRAHYANELHRIISRNGALLLSVPNQKCPLDLTRNTRIIHHFSDEACITRKELIKVFHLFNIKPMMLEGHFSWSRLPFPLKVVGRWFDWNWKFVLKPESSNLYFSPFNPLFNLWLTPKESREGK